ncbi:unknown [Cercopithecine alphaherpesvirus 9]|uniref:Tegument protein UL21 n=1 Tax=Cercopithecine herpesvirus 9 (strain DHV) TaxID=36348 RepID=Q9E1Y1_CHV9D|nr:tegument protein UL21 [Cercopithecine alphaherpesvirus 9]AAG27212.1 unknown [Cercopithecine alphaherpesvirus 9]
MEFNYSSTIVHNGVTFYLNDRATRAYFICGGCIFSIPRKPEGEIAKFGHVVRGVGPGDESIASYLRSELNRVGKEWATPMNNNYVFIDRVALLSSGPKSNERDLCGMFDIDVEDSTLAEYIVSLPVSKLTLISGADVFRDHVLKLFSTPTAVNTVNGFMYVPNELAFKLVHMRLYELPDSLCDVVKGLFTKIPAVEDVDNDQTSVIVKKRAADVVNGEDIKMENDDLYTSLQRERRKSEKRITLSNFVQVRTIPRVINIWDPRRKATTHSIRELACIVQFAENIIFKDDAWPGLDEELCNVRENIYSAVIALYGEDNNIPFFGNICCKHLNSCQKFVLIQYIMSCGEAFNCYSMLEDLLRSYISAMPPTEDLDIIDDSLLNEIVDAANGILREVGFVGALAEQLVFVNLPQLAFYKSVSDIAKVEAVRLIRLARTGIGLLGVPDPLTTSERHEYEMARYLDKLYAGESCNVGAIRLCSVFKCALPIAVYYNVFIDTAFETGVCGKRHIAYLNSLFFGRIGTTITLNPRTRDVN